MKKLLTILFIFLSTSNARGQSSSIDSLESLVKSLKGPQRVDVLNKIAFELLSYDNEKSKKAASVALELSVKLKYEIGEAQALLFMGATQSSFGKKELSSKLIKQSISLSSKINQKGIAGYGLTFLGANYEKTNQLDSALFSYNKAYDLLKDSTAPYYLSFLYLHFADYYKNRNDRDEQLRYLNKCWKIREKQKEKKYLVWIGEMLASYYTDQAQYKEATAYLNRVQTELGRDTIDNEEISFIYRQRAIIYINQGRFSEAFSLLSKAKKYFERVNDQFELLITQSEMGYLFMDIANYEQSLKNYFEALGNAEKFQYEYERTKILARVAWVYYELRQNERCEEFVKKTLTLSKVNSYKTEESFALNLLGLLADRQNRNMEAIEYFNQALAIRKNIKLKNGIASTLLNIGIVYEKQGKLQQALEYDLKCLETEEATGHKIGIAYASQSLGQLFVKLKRYDEAEKFLTKGEFIAREMGASSILVDILRNRRDLSIAQNKYQKVVEFSLMYDALKDSIFSRDLSERISNLQNIFQLGQKENEITILNQQKELQTRKLQFQEGKLRQQTFIIVIGTVGFILLAIISYVIFQYYSKVKTLNKDIQNKSEEIQTQAEELSEANEVLSRLNRDIREQKEEIQAQAEELTESNQAISGINETLEERIEARTAELKQAYKELDTFFYRSSHDFRRPLTTFMGLAEVAKITVKDQNALELFDKVNETARNLDKMLMKLQSISDLGVQELLYKEVLVKELMKMGLDSFNQELHLKGVKVDIDVDPNLSFYSYPALIKIIFDNLIENSISFRKEAGARLMLRAFTSQGGVVVEFEDNGQGIEEQYLGQVFEMYFRGNEQSKGNGLGLYIVQKTAAKLKGRVSISSKIGMGTKVTIFFPQSVEDTVKT